MAKKLTYEEVKYFIDVESDSGCKLLSEEYINNETKLNIRCNCGEVFETSFVKFKYRDKRQCDECGNYIRYDYDKVQYFIEIESMSGCKLLSKEYINITTLMLFQCKCGNKYTTDFGHFKNHNKRQCNECGVKTRVNKRKLLYEYVQQFILDSGYQLLSNDYKNNSTKLQIMCDKNHVYYTTFNNFKKGYRCPYCAGTEKKEIAYYREQFANRDYMLLADEYIYSYTPMKYICLKHKDKIQYMAWDNLKQGKGCKFCAIENNSGENNLNWKGGITELNNHLRHLLNEWKAKSLEKYDYKCSITNITTPDLHIHHLLSFNIIVQNTLDELNLPIRRQVNGYTKEQLKAIETNFLEQHDQLLGIPLHENIHTLFHQQYGYGDNTPEQFDEFKTRLKEGEFLDFLEENNLSLVI